MANNRHKPEEIVTKQRQAEVLVGQGMARIDAIREVWITDQTFYRWRTQYGGMGTDVVDVLPDLFIMRGVPPFIRLDNGPEFVAKAIRTWINAVGLKTADILPSSPW